MTSEKRINKFEGFVLAGGKSRRMGTDKAMLEFGDKTFLQRAWEVLSPVCEGRVRIVLNRNQPAADFSSFDIIRDIFPERGALGGIQAALVNSKSLWTVILACDLPMVSSETINELSKAALSSSDEIAAIVPRQEDGRLQPLCALYRPSLCLPALNELLHSQTTASVRDFLKLVQTTYVENFITPIDQESAFFNVNTPADYELLSEK